MMFSLVRYQDFRDSCIPVRLPCWPPSPRPLFSNGILQETPYHWPMGSYLMNFYTWIVPLRAVNLVHCTAIVAASKGGSFAIEIHAEVGFCSRVHAGSCSTT